MGDQNQYSGVQSAPQSKQVVYREEKRPLRKLTQVEMELAKRRRILVHLYMPELIPQIEQLTEHGLIDGWRSVCFVRVHETGEEV